MKNYFAYGSNMFARRLRARVHSAKVIGTYRLSAHQLLFHKISDDGSGKCDAFYSGDENDMVIGRLYTIDDREEKKLDKFECLGTAYYKKEVRVTNVRGETETAFTYYAKPECIVADIRPWNWYKQHVLAGAQEAQLPDDYIAKIKAVLTEVDPNTERAQPELALHKS